MPDETKTQKPKRIVHFSFGYVLWFGYSFSSRVYVCAGGLALRVAVLRQWDHPEVRLVEEGN